MRVVMAVVVAGAIAGLLYLSLDSGRFAPPAARAFSMPLVGLVDLVPTVLELARIPAPATLDGRSLAPLLAGQSQGREWVLTENDHEMGFVLHLRTLTTERYVLTRYDTMPGVGELYDRALDPGEIENRWDDPAYTEIRRDLLALLAEVANPRPRRLPNTGSLA